MDAVMQRVITWFYQLVNSPKRLFFTVVGSWVTLSWTYSLVEGKGPIEGLWWGVVTGSTVGYGDFYPESTLGRFIGFLTIITGLLLTAAVVTYLMNLANRDAWTHEEQEELINLVRHNNAMLIVLLSLEDNDQELLHAAREAVHQHYHHKNGADHDITDSTEDALERSGFGADARRRVRAHRLRRGGGARLRGYLR